MYVKQTLHLVLLLLCRLQEPTWKDSHGSWTAQILRGHIKFYSSTCQARHADSATLQATDTQTPAAAQSPSCLLGDGQQKALLALHMLRTDRGPVTIDHLGTSSHMEEDEEGILGTSPTSSITNMWAGPALSLSLKSALADHNSKESLQANTTADSRQVSIRAVPSSSAGQSQGVAASNKDEQQAGLFAVSTYVARDHGCSVEAGSIADKPKIGRSNGQTQQAEPAVDRPSTGKGNGHSQQAGPSQDHALHGSGPTQQAGPSGEQGLNSDGHTQQARPSGEQGLSNGGHSQEAGPARQLEIQMVPAGPELVDVEFPLYLKYQVSSDGENKRMVWSGSPDKTRRKQQILTD